jgi:hypothetical protein
MSCVGVRLGLSPLNVAWGREQLIHT